MKLSEELKRLDDMSNKLQMFLSGLRVPEEPEGVIEYARNEAEAIFDRVTWLELMVGKGEMPDAEFPGPRGTELEGCIIPDADAGSIPDCEGMA